MEDSYFNDRKFQFWYYHVSHGEALIRSLKDNIHDTNIDLYFAAIEYIEIPRQLSNLRIKNAQKADRLYNISLLNFCAGI